MLRGGEKMRGGIGLVLGNWGVCLAWILELM